MRPLRFSSRLETRALKRLLIEADFEDMAFSDFQASLA
jgi:hypothetical protein